MSGQAYIRARPGGVDGDGLPPYATPEFLALRERWYQRLEAEGHEIEELAGFKPRRARAHKGPARGDPRRYGLPIEAVTDDTEAEHANVRIFGGPKRVWDLDNAEYWRLVSANVEALPATYKGKAFLRRWAEIGDVRTASTDCGLSRWHGRKIQERFVELLRRKRVLQ